MSGTKNATYCVCLPLAQRFLWFFEKHISDQKVILKGKISAFGKIFCKLVLQNHAPHRGRKHVFKKNDKKLKKTGCVKHEKQKENSRLHTKL